MSSHARTSIICTILFITLLYQGVLLVRNELVSYYPNLYNILSKQSEFFGLKMQWKSVNNGANVEIAELQKLSSGIYSLTLSIKANSNYAIKSPNLKITLKDINGNQVASSIISGSNWLKKEYLLPDEFVNKQIHFKADVDSLAVDYMIELI